jgi:RNA 2',3'-cyclic 3'-phosphodiesterase
MRLFVAIKIPDEIKKYLVYLQEIIGNVAKIRWVSKDGMHMTLKFLGEVQANNLIGIKSGLQRVKFSAFTLQLNSLGMFPSENYIRVIWMGLEPEVVVVGLQKDIEANLNELFSNEKDFKAHITLGRVKYVKDKSMIGKLNAIKIENKVFNVNSFSLVKSTLTEKGSIYEDIQVFGAQ